MKKMDETFIINISALTDIVRETLMDSITLIDDIRIDFGNGNIISYWVVLLALFAIDVIVNALMGGVSVKEN